VSNQLGGLAKKASYIRQHKAEVDAVLVVDAGDLLTPAAPGMLKGVTTREDIAARAEVLARLEATIGLHAVAVGERDLALGLRELRRLAKAHRLRLLAANLADKAGKPAFEGGFVTEVAGEKVGLLGLTDVPEAQRGPITEAGLTILPPLPAAEREVARLRAAGATIVVALAHVGVPAARELLRTVKGIDLAVVGHTSNAISTPERIGDGYLVEAQRQGKQLGEFLLHLLPGGGAFADRGQRRGLADQLTASRREYDRLARQIERETVEKRRALYRASLDRVRGTLEQTCARLQEAPPTVTGRWLEHRLVPMDRSLADDTPIAALVTKHMEELARAALRRPQPAPGTSRSPRAAGAQPAASMALRTLKPSGPRAAATAAPPKRPGGAAPAPPR
jgi:2',3'-cyclic-nucleotide 2'-phosphodiesterase (5'-nucleotidase family)